MRLTVVWGRGETILISIGGDTFCCETERQPADDGVMKVADYQIIIMRRPEHLTGHYHHHYRHYHHHCGHQLISDGLTGRGGKSKAG